MIIKICSIPEEKLKLFNTLYHWTSIEKAISILEGKNIYGTDVGRHANFHISDKIKDYEKDVEICLTFTFSGINKLLFGDTFDETTPPQNSGNSIFHLISDGDNYDPEDIETFSKLEHSQSNVYPNTTGLIFKGINWSPNPKIPDNYEWHCHDIFKNNEINIAPIKPYFFRRKARVQYKCDYKTFTLKQRLLSLEKDARDKAFTVIPQELK